MEMQDSQVAATQDWVWRYLYAHWHRNLPKSYEYSESAEADLGSLVHWHIWQLRETVTNTSTVPPTIFHIWLTEFGISC